jgi:DNA-binding HxlR family transcriptional regulator
VVIPFPFHLQYASDMSFSDMAQEKSPVRTAKPTRSNCPINFGLEIFGDPWSLLILRDMLIVGKRGFKDFQGSEEGIASNILTNRLKRLEACGIIRREKSPSDGRQVVYLPTEAGQALLPILVEMSFWGATYDPATGAPAGFVANYKADRDGLLRAIVQGFDPSKA